MKAKIFYLIPFMFIICLQTEAQKTTPTCIDFISKDMEGRLDNGTVVKVDNGTTRIYTNSGYFKFDVDSTACTAFNSEESLYDLYANKLDKDIKRFDRIIESFNDLDQPMEAAKANLKRAKLILACENEPNKTLKDKLEPVISRIKELDARKKLKEERAKADDVASRAKIHGSKNKNGSQYKINQNTNPNQTNKPAPGAK